MEQPTGETGGPKIPDSAKEPILACPICGRSVDGGFTMTKETCPYEDCKRKYQVLTYK